MLKTCIISYQDDLIIHPKVCKMAYWNQEQKYWLRPNERHQSIKDSRHLTPSHTIIQKEWDIDLNTQEGFLE